MTARAAVSILVLVGLLAGGCTSPAHVVQTARKADDVALLAPLPDAAWVVVGDGHVTGVATEDDAFATDPGARHRYVYRPAERGDRALRMAYLPGSGVIAGRAAAAALGLGLSRSTHSGIVLSHDVRRLVAGDDAAVTLQIAAPDGTGGRPVRVVLDPDFDGALLVSPALAADLGLARFEIPGRADVQVALGRPFTARRARVRVTIPELDAAGTVEAIHPAAVP